MVDAVGIEPTTCRLRVEGESFPTGYCDCLWSAQNQRFRQVVSTLPVHPMTAICCPESPVFSPVCFRSSAETNLVSTIVACSLRL
jgi:hypothetical protein